jgi:hypothetical protein
MEWKDVINLKRFLPLQAIALTATKEKQAVLEWIQLKVLLDNSGKSINGLSPDFRVKSNLEN